ncbi:hypothetical protein [Marinobacter changyiensis]|uniref:hypothetical protein n=1 Tax=Marinobacter changyiensis TaxID=2604091 RepID=UPI0012653321|nr:hypothetical protein [Marinobacter changyiensis]
MNSMASERSWLLDPGLLKLVHQCRRLIHSEFGVKLHLTEALLEQRLATYAEQSRSTDLSRTWKALKEQVPGLEALSEVPGKRNYRGQQIADAMSSMGSADDEHVNHKTKTIIYRGQVMTQ